MLADVAIDGGLQIDDADEHSALEPPAWLKNTAAVLDIGYSGARGEVIADPLFGDIKRQIQNQELSRAA